MKDKLKWSFTIYNALKSSLRLDSRWAVGTAASGCTQSARSSLLQSGRTVQLVNQWSHCSGPKPDQQSSVCSMEPLTSTYGTCWKTTPSLLSPKGYILTGNTSPDMMDDLEVFLFRCIDMRWTCSALFSGWQPWRCLETQDSKTHIQE